jgi:DNA primase
MLVPSDTRGFHFTNMNYANEIKSRLTMPQVLDYYGIERNRANRIRCVLHNGQDFNCGIKDHYIHCFVCGQSADVIKFVQVYFGLDFQSAISKLNDDFCLGLPIGQRIDRRKKLEMGRIAFERKRKAEQQQKERQQIEDDYWAAFDEWKRLDDNRRNYAPKSPTEPLHPLFVEALKNIAGAEYNLSCAEIARYEYENRNSHNS